MAVDPGWVTDVLDRLEERGYVARRPSPDDRRVTLTELTFAELNVLLKIAERLAAAAKVEPGPILP